MNTRRSMAILFVLTSLIVIATLPWVHTNETGVSAQTRSVGPNPVDERRLLAGAKVGNSSEVNTMLSKGTNPNAQDPNGWTPLMFASIRGDAIMVGNLIRAGGNLDAISRDGASPLMVATLKRHINVVSVLLQNNATVALKNDDGMNALIIAEEKGWSEIVAMLRNADQRGVRERSASLTPPRRDDSLRDGITGTSWSGVDTVTTPMRVIFEPGGRVRLSLRDQWSTGTWRQNGNDVNFEVNDRYVEYRGTIFGSSMNGSAENRGGISWRWKIDRD